MERVNFTWYDHSGHVTDAIQEMFFSNAFKDVTLVSEDRKHINAHRNILTACSPVFRYLLNLDKNSNQLIYLRGVQFSDLESIFFIPSAPPITSSTTWVTSWSTIEAAADL